MAESRTFEVSPHSGYYKNKFKRKLGEKSEELTELTRTLLDQPVEDLVARLGRQALYHRPKYSQKHLTAMRFRFLGSLPGLLRYYKVVYFLFIMATVVLLWWSTTDAAPVPAFLPDATWVKGLGYVAMLVVVGLSQWYRSYLEVARKRQVDAMEDEYAFHCGREFFVSLVGSTFFRERFPLEDAEAGELTDDDRAVEYVFELVERLVEDGALALIGSLETATAASVLVVNDARAQARGEVYLTGDLLGIDLSEIDEMAEAGSGEPKPAAQES